MSANCSTTINGTKLSSYSLLAAEGIGITLAYCLIVVFSLAANSFVGIIVYRTRAMRKPINFLIVNMAMSDLLYPIFVLPWVLADMYVESWHIIYPLGQALCKLLYFLPNVSITVSVQSLVLIAVDRFGAVVCPLRSPLISSKLCPFFIVATWIAAVSMFAPNASASKFVEYPGKLMCELRWKETFGNTANNRDYVFALLMILFCIPFTLTTILYSIILLKLKFQKFPGKPSEETLGKRLKRHRKVLKMVIAIVLGFAICWTPLSTFYFLTLFVWEGTTKHPCGLMRLFWFITFFMAHANCAINPCICFIFSDNYRKGLKSFLNKCCLLVGGNFGMFRCALPFTMKKKTYTVNNQ